MAYDEVHDNKNSTSGIKLFGTTISVQERESANNNEPREVDQITEQGPRKMIIPCPRCKSMDTKFCYFNNYSVNQPRHFCKGCQRYWTAGGALRNVPVGSGRRKTSRSPCRGFTILPEGYFLHASMVKQMGFDARVKEWQEVEHVVFRQHLPTKRRRSTSSSLVKVGNKSCT